MSFLLDSNVLSEPTKPKPSDRVMEWLKEHEDESFLSVITVGELQRGVHLYPVSKKRNALEKWLEELLGSFENRIVPIDRTIAEVWGKYYAAQQSGGRKPPSLDSWVAATALVHRFTIVSRNVVDFPDVPILNVWER